MAQFNLALMYYDGTGFNKNYEKAVKWFEKAAEQGDNKAQYYLGSIYYEGKGVSKNVTEATKWFRRAAEQGFQPAKDILMRLSN